MEIPDESFLCFLFHPRHRFFYSRKIIFTIDEGPKVRIGDIGFEGNTVFSEGELRGALELTKERGLISHFKGKEKFIKDKLEYDLNLNLLEQYREVGYLYAKAGEPSVQIVEAPRGWLLFFRKTKAGSTRFHRE